MKTSNIETANIMDSQTKFDNMYVERQMTQLNYHLRQETRKDNRFNTHSFNVLFFSDDMYANIACMCAVMNFKSRKKADEF